MFNKIQSILASRLASAMLAAVLFAALTAPFVMLQSMQAFAGAAPLPCTEGNNNGCTELSATPPEDLQSVPPNLVLMLDDSGSMAWDFMPDWDYLGAGLPGNWNQYYYGVRNPAINGLYYNPATTYAPPPKADGTAYPDSPGLKNAFYEGFNDPTAKDITSYAAGAANLAHQSFPYYLGLGTTKVIKTFDPPTVRCPSGYSRDPNDATMCIKAPDSQITVWTCNPGDGIPDKNHICTHSTGEGTPTTYRAKAVSECPAGSSLDVDGLCHYPPKPVSLSCGTGSLYKGECVGFQYNSFFTYTLGTPGKYKLRYVGAGTDCDIINNGSDKAACVNEADISGKSAPAGVAAGQNVANWFSYYRTRMLMAKSGLMIALSNLDPKYRFGFASLNGNGKDKIPNSPAYVTFDDSFSLGGDSVNRLAVVQPFGVGSDSTSQRTKFWNWIANESPQNGTPLRKALDAVGKYYQTAQPWTTMPGDAGYTDGSTTQFACRASYTILTTDGFWNGNAPSGIGYAAGVDGPDNSPVPSGDIKQYVAGLPSSSPYPGGRVGGSEPSLADVATYYWANDLSAMPNQVAPSAADPAAWQHMTTFTIGLGFDPAGIQPAGTTVPQILAWARGGAAIPGFSWPTPLSDNINNIADLAHAAVNGHGDFFNVKKPGDLEAAFTKALTDISARTVAPTPTGVNASVLSVGAVAFRTGYSTGDWTGQFQAVTLKTDGTVDTILWKADALLDGTYHSPTGYATRNVYTSAYKSSTFSSFKLTAGNKASLDAVETAGLQVPALAGGDDTLGNRINYLLGDNTYEGATYRTRSSILGAILRAEPVYVAGATGNYRDSWPTFGPASAPITPPEAVPTAQTFAAFVSDQAARVAMAYVGANDGMLHAFHAPVPDCTGTIDVNGNCTAYTFPSGSKQGEEAWAFVPRAVYANLGNLTSVANFKFRPTVDASPVSRDVFFSGDKKWHTLLAGGVGVGGRGAYGLDITDPTAFSATSVLWEFDADMPLVGCVANDGSCNGKDLGYTVAQPNVGRLSNGKWVVLVPNGYFPDCDTPNIPTADKPSCQSIADQAPKDALGNPYSALFVLDAESGKVIAELKTPTDQGVTSFGLAKPVMGDYNSDQVDDVAFAGDVQGNLWRFDMSDPDPTMWKVTLVYKGLSAGGHQGVQPITTMPRLFPDPTTNRFMVLFGTGKYLGVGDNSNDVVQAIIAVRDSGTTYSQANLTQQFLHETVVAAGLPNAGASLRCVTRSETEDCTTTTNVNAVTSSAGGWYVNLSTTTSGGVRNNSGERVVVNPGAIFASNTVIFESLITGAESADACNPSTQGAILALNVTTGGSAGVSSLGEPPIAGGRISNARTSGSLPVVSALGGGKAYLPGATLAPGNTPIAIDAPIWRRRSWRVLMNDQ